jgi:transcriptional regulator with XRE-family HTH domain
MENTLQNTMTERIKKALFEHKLNLTEFADRMGVKKQSVSQMINGETSISAKFILTLAKECPRTNLRWILTGEGEEMPRTLKDDGGNYYNPLQEKDKQIDDLHEMIKSLITKIPGAETLREVE